jgi:hypothetical protein
VSARLLYRKHWPEDINSQLTFGEKEIRKLSIILQVKEKYNLMISL